MSVTDGARNIRLVRRTLVVLALFVVLAGLALGLSSVGMAKVLHFDRTFGCGPAVLEMSRDRYYPNRSQIPDEMWRRAELMADKGQNFDGVRIDAQKRRYIENPCQGASVSRVTTAVAIAMAGLFAFGLVLVLIR